MHRDLALGVGALALSAAYYWMAAAIPEGQLADAIGPRGLPTTYAICLAALALVLIVGSRARPGDTGPGGWVLWRVGGMLGMGVVYILVVPFLGYLLSIAALILATTYYQGGALNGRVALVALCGGVFFWLLFVVMMGIPQPPGWWPLPL